MWLHVPCSLLFDIDVLGFSSVQNLQEITHTCSHSSMHVSLGAFYVVVKIVAENLDARDSLLSDIALGKVLREKDCNESVWRVLPG